MQTHEDACVVPHFERAGGGCDPFESDTTNIVKRKALEVQLSLLPFEAKAHNFSFLCA